MPFCRECGVPLTANATVCNGCGCTVRSGPPPLPAGLPGGLDSAPVEAPDIQGPGRCGAGRKPWKPWHKRIAIGCGGILVLFVVAMIIGVVATRKANETVAEGDKLWSQGEKAKAVAKYMEVKRYWKSVAKKRLPVLLKRVIEFSLDSGDKAQAREAVTFAIKRKVTVDLKLASARTLWAEIEEELKTAVVEVEYPKVVEQRKSPYENVGSPFWSFSTVFKETAGNCSYTVEGYGHILDVRGKKWVTDGRSSISRGELKVPAGSSSTDDYWCASQDHKFCNGYAIFTWSGKDEGDHRIEKTVRVHLKHTGCPGYTKP